MVDENIIVTTGDLKQDYEVIGPVFFQVSNKGVLSTQLSELIKQYEVELDQLKQQGQIEERKTDWGFLYGEFTVGQNDFSKAFFVGVQELKKRAAMLGADAVVAMRQDIDLDTSRFQFFYLQMYGTAVRLK
jgi:putative heavy-metal-binding protein